MDKEIDLTKLTEEDIGTKVTEVELGGGINLGLVGFEENGDLVTELFTSMQIKFRGPLASQLFFALAEQMVICAMGEGGADERHKGALAELLRTEEGKKALADFQPLKGASEPVPYNLQ